MNDWYRNPALQGPENDYGQYDYLVEDLPSDYVKWEYSKYVSKCDSCGKERRLLLKSAHYFYTLDGYDYMNYDECWVCRLKSKMYTIKYKIKKKIEVAKDAWTMARTNSTGNFRYYYNILKEIKK